MRVVLYIKIGSFSWILIKSLLTPFLPRRPSAKPVVAPSLPGQTLRSKTSNCTRTGTSQSCISWPGTTMLSIPLASILSIEKLVLRDIQTTEYEIITKESGTITLDVV